MSKAWPLFCLACICAVAACQSKTPADHERQVSAPESKFAAAAWNPAAGERPLRGDSQYDFGEYAGDDDIATEALELLRRGNAAFRQRDSEEALAVWDGVIERYPNTPAWNMAVLNSGTVFRAQGEFERAASVLLRLLADEENYAQLGKSGPYGINGVSAIEWYLDHFNGDWHAACVMISECYEDSGDLEKAHEYAVLERDKFSPRHWCGVAWASERSILDERIASLARRLKAAAVPVPDGLNGPARAEDVKADLAAP